MLIDTIITVMGFTLAITAICLYEKIKKLKDKNKELKKENKDLKEIIEIRRLEIESFQSQILGLKLGIDSEEKSTLTHAEYKKRF